MIFEGLNPNQLMSLVKDAGTLGILMLAVAGLLRGWIVPKWVHDATIAERDQWRQVATEGLNNVKQLIELAELVRPMNEPRPRRRLPESGRDSHDRTQ